jgi:hypothetical protein
MKNMFGYNYFALSGLVIHTAYQRWVAPIVINNTLSGLDFNTTY